MFIKALVFRLNNAEFVNLLYAQRKKENYERLGYDVILHRGIFPSDKYWEVWAFEKWHQQRCPTCHGRGYT